MFNEQFYLEMSRYFKMQYTFICFIFMFLTGKCILKINYRNSLKLMGGKKMLWKITSILFSLFHIKKTETRPYKVYGCGHSLQHFITRTYFP